MAATVDEPDDDSFVDVVVESGILVLAPANAPAPGRRTKRIVAKRLRPGDRLGSGYVVLTVGQHSDLPEHLAVIAVGSGRRFRYTWRKTLPVLVYRHPDDDEEPQAATAVESSGRIPCPFGCGHETLTETAMASHLAWHARVEP